MDQNIIQKAKNAVLKKYQSFSNTQSGQVINRFGSDFGRTFGNIGLGITSLAQGLITQPLANQRTNNLLNAQSLAKKAMTAAGPEKQIFLQQSRDIYNQPNISQGLNLKLAGFNLDTRKSLGVEKTGIVPFLKSAAPAANVALTGLGGAKLVAMPLVGKLTTLGVSAGLSGGMGALTGKNILDSATAGVLQAPRLVGMTGVTAPIIKYGASGVMDKFATPLARNIVGRGLTGLGNVVEDEILSRLNNIKPGVADRVLSFGIGALLAPTKEYEEYLQSERPEVSKKIREVIRNAKGQFAKEAGISPKNLDYMVQDPNSRHMILRSKLDEKVPGIMSDLEKINKYMEDKTNGFGSIAKAVKENDSPKYNQDVLDAVKSGNITPEEASLYGVDVKGLTPEVTGKVKLKVKNALTGEEVTTPKPEEFGGIKLDEGNVKTRGLVESVQEAPNVSKKVKLKVKGEYEVKPNTKLMGEAKVLLSELPEGSKIDFKNVKDVDQKVAATIQEAINLQKKGNYEAAANLYNNLSEHATELGRGVQAFSLLKKMSPEAISLSTAARIKKYNLTASKPIPELTGAQQKMITDQIKIIDSLEGREKNIAINDLKENLNDLIPSSFVDKAITVWKAGLLTSLRTHERNLLGNTIMYGGEVAKDVPGSMADTLMSLRTGKRTLTPTLQGSKEGAIKGSKAAVDIVKYGFDPEESISKFDIKRVTWDDTPTQQFLKKATDAVFRPLTAEDKVFWHSAYARSLYDQAGAEAINAGKKGNMSFVNKLVNNPTDSMLSTAFRDANDATFHDPTVLGKIATSVKNVAKDPKFGGNTGIGKIVTEMTAPFTGVPSSIAAKTIAYSPIGLVNGAVKVGRVLAGQVPQLQRQAAQEVGRGVIGTGLFGLGAYLMSKGLMTGQPKDQAESRQWELEGKQANSIFIGGKWRSINSIGPQNLIMLAGAKLKEEMNDPEGSVGNYLGKIARDQLEQTMLRGVKGPLDAIMDPNRYGKSYIGGTVASLIPNIVKDVSKSVDKFQRETNTTGEYLKQAIPVLRNQNLPKRGVFGEPLKQEPTGLGAFVDLFNSKTPISNNVIDELSRLNEAGFNATPSKLQKNQTLGNEKLQLTPEQLDKLEAEAGPKIFEGINILISSPAYQRLNDQDKKDAIDSLVIKIRKQVKSTIKVTAEGIDKGYETSPDSPQGLGKVGTYGKAIVTDPGATIKAVLSGQPIRKTEGGVVILERKKGLSSLDRGDQTTQIDHIVPLSLGGSNTDSNLEELTVQEHEIKTAIQNEIVKQLRAGKISKEQAFKQASDWRKQSGILPQTKQKELAQSVTQYPQYQVISESSTGKSSVDIVEINSPIKMGELTGYTELDKKIKSKYTSAITKRINDITKVYESGQISAQEAEGLIALVKQSKAKTVGSGSKKITFKQPKRIALKSIKIPKVKLIKLAKFKIPKAPKLKKFKMPKLAKLKTKTIKV